MTTRVLAVLAHPDDEVIFGWPVFQNRDLKKSLIMLVSDRNNAERAWCARRIEPLQELCRQEGIRLTCLDMNSEFYRTPYRRAEFCINDIYRQTLEAMEVEIERFSPDFVFTHNPHGEYGMFDHRLVFDVVYHHSPAENVVITDLTEAHEGWPSSDTLPPSIRELYYAKSPAVTVTLDAEFYLRGKQLYEQVECWTWKQAAPPAYPPASCRLHLLKGTSHGEAKLVALGD